jgi:hypothetical protein
MRPPVEAASHLLHSGLLRSASLLVPGPQRAEWLREWRGELWHVRQACAPVESASWNGQREVVAFCLGAFQDARCLRRAGNPRRLSFAGLTSTPRQCLMILGAVLAASYALALLLPGVRAERSLWPRKVNPNLVLIQVQGSNYNGRPSITPAQLRSWQGHWQKYFDGFAFYRVTREAVALEQGPGRTQTRVAWAVASASSNLFTLLGLPVRFTDSEAAANLAAGSDLPQVILSEKAWKRQFGADPHIAGGILRLGTRMVRVAGIAPDGSLDLPGGVDAWVLEPEPAAGSKNAGFVVAHLTAAGQAEMWADRVEIAATRPDGTEDDLLGVSLEEWRPSPESLYLFAIFLALLALPAITTVSLGEYSVNPQKTSWSRRLYRWSFLASKAALLLPILYFVSLDVAYACSSIGRENQAYIQLVSTFGLCLFGLRWVLKDQRQRCPVCMHCVTHPAQVGQASRTFLDWNGTEMMCMGGHTLLHVPSLPTSWFGAQRWLYLDTSWNFLFASSTRPIP